MSIILKMIHCILDVDMKVQPCDLLIPLLNFSNKILDHSAPCFFVNVQLRLQLLKIIFQFLLIDHLQDKWCLFGEVH